MYLVQEVRKKPYTEILDNLCRAVIYWLMCLTLPAQGTSIGHSTTATHLRILYPKNGKYAIVLDLQNLGRFF
jgi:ABC-type Co2+ transport system permease subunit